MSMARYSAMAAANLLRNFISFYHQAYRVAVWSSRQNFRYVYGWLSRPYSAARIPPRAYAMGMSVDRLDGCGHVMVQRHPEVPCHAPHESLGARGAHSAPTFSLCPCGRG
jgi:hypothetical protein